MPKIPVKLGAHLSTAGGYAKVFERAQTIGANCLQIFSTSPRTWNAVHISDADARVFAAEKKRCGIEPVYFHASYLINLAAPGETGRLSVRSLAAELAAAEKIGVKGSVVHLGSFKNGDSDTPPEGAYERLIKNIGGVLQKTPPAAFFIIENSGTRKIGRKLSEIGRIISDLGSPRLKVCLDTCHLHAAGYDLRSEEKLGEFLDEFDSQIGLDRLELFHLNDSRDPFGSFRDRHDNIGEGRVGMRVFELLLNHPRTRHLSFIIETPGFDGLGPDKKNLDILRGLFS